MSKRRSIKKAVARSEENKIELREKMLREAIKIVLEKGFGELSIRKLADKIGYAPGTIYLYFNSRDELVREICVQGFSELGTSLKEVANKNSEPKKRLVEFLKSYAEFAVKNPETYRLSFMENPKFTEEIFRNAPLDEENGAGKQALDSLTDTFRELKENGEIAADEDENLLAEVFWTAIHGVVSLKLIYPAIPFNSVEKLVDKTIETLLAGTLK